LSDSGPSKRMGSGTVVKKSVMDPPGFTLGDVSTARPTAPTGEA
jgi:hypothetical protein